MAPLDPEEATASDVPAVAEIPAATSLGAVHLSVADLERSISFYERVIGLTVADRGASRVALGAGAHDLLVLDELPGATPSRRYSGLFHFALLLPERTDLARWLAHAARDRVPLSGLSDHFVSEAIYLDDPDHHGIEIYWDRPRATWEGRVAERMTTLPLDTDDLLGTLEDPAAETFDGMPAETTMGHLHLRVADIPETVAFYRDVLGFALMVDLGSAAFLSAGGYHHHLGANTWQSPGAPQPPAGSATLEQATIVLPDESARDRIAGQASDAGLQPEATPTGVRLLDPSGNPLELQTAAG